MEKKQVLFGSRVEGRAALEFLKENVMYSTAAVFILVQINI
tara:strand:- start:987 stop:1109 length:123 start_codon:yes stop_codon:yes gene_type:complete